MLHIHRSERADPLVGALAEILRDAPPDPFARELVAVPTHGMERWLTQRLSGRLGARPGHGDGVCANVLFPSPRAMIGDALGVAGGVDPEQDPWPAARLVWPLIGVVEDCMEEDWLAPLAGHLRGGRARRFARVQAIARLFEEYGIRRPELIQAWARGAFDSDAPGGWQSQLWYQLRERLGVPSPAERLPQACARLRESPELVELPQRLALFGLTRLPAAHLQALSALSRSREIHLMLLHPSAALWSSVAADPSAEAHNRLLASWGREVRELQSVLSVCRIDSGFDTQHPLAVGSSEPATLLATLQADIREDRRPPGVPLPGQPDRRLALADDDGSVRVHSCHGRARQVEVLREAILHRLADDPTLELRDVIVMCPDIETFAPLIEASFGSAAGLEPEEGRPTELRVRLADRSLRQTNPVLGVIARLLELTEGRVTASEVLDLADRGPVRTRFGFDDDDLAQIREWVGSAGIHWGLDAQHRGAYRLSEVEVGTWDFGLRRVLVGVTMSESGRQLFERVLPLDDVHSGSIELAGRLAELVDRLGWVVRALTGPHTVSGWAQALTSAADMLTAVPERDAWQPRELNRILDELAEASVRAGDPPELTLPEIRAAIGDRLQGRPTRANFRTGHLTICTLMPMRSVPHRVVCLLGLDDGSFPRQSSHDGDDLLLLDPRPGDRDPRSEDRQLLLDALMAAGDALVITYSGNDERTNAPRPPAVPVGELLEAIDATAYWTEPGPTRGDRSGGTSTHPARDRVRICHPLQPFDPSNFVADRLRPGAPWSFESVSLEGARAFIGERSPPPPFLDRPLGRAQDTITTLSLSDLIAFVEHPVRAFLRQRIGITLATSDDEIEDSLPIELSGLGAWAVGQRLLDGVLAGGELRSVALAEIARGTLPPGELGRPALRVAWHHVQALQRLVGAYSGSAEPRSSETNFLLDDGTRVTGTVSGVRDHVALTVSYSRLAARHRLAAWVRLLALNAAHPEVPFEAVTVGRSGDEDSPVVVARIPTLGATPEVRAATARLELERLALLFREGMSSPLALPSQTTAAYAEALRSGQDPIAAAEGAWRSGWRGGRRQYGEDNDPEYLRVFGPALRLAALECHALTLWGPLLDRETVQTP